MISKAQSIKILDKLSALDILSVSQMNNVYQELENLQDSLMVNDKIWQVLNHALDESAKKFRYSEKMIQTNREIYLLMFQLLVYEGKDRTSVTKLIIKCDLDRTDFIPYKNNIVLIPPQDCDYGKQFNEMEISLEKARTDFPIKFENCTRSGGCVCCIGLIPLRNESGRLIMKP